MNKLLKNILVCTTIMCCSNNLYSSTGVNPYNVLYDIDRKIFDQCQVETIPGTHFGKIYYQAGNKKEYLEDEDRRPYFDLRTVVKNKTVLPISNYIANGGWNLIIKICSSPNTYMLCNPLDIINKNTTLIVPKGITLINSGLDNMIYFHEDIDNCNLLLFGNIISNSNNKCAVCFDSTNESANVKIIIGSSGTLCHGDNIQIPSPVYSSFNESKFLLYPGCTLDKQWLTNNENVDTFRKAGHLYLNRFVNEKNSENRNKLSGQIFKNMHVILPIIDSQLSFDIDNNVIINSKNKNYVATSYFPNLYWIYNDNPKPTEGNKAGAYSFEEARAPLTFNIDKLKNKAILGLNPDNEFAKYDAKLWNECSLNEGKYSLRYYDFPTPTGSNNKYFNVDNAYKLFYGVNKDDTKLTINTSTIYLGIIGKKEIEFNLKNSINKNILYLYGDNKQYTGTMTIPETVKDIYLKTISKIGKIKYKNNIYANDKIPGVTFHYIDKPTLTVTPTTSTNNQSSWNNRQKVDNKVEINNKYNLDLAEIGNNIKMDLTNSMYSSNAIILKDSGLIQNSILWLTGDNRDFKGIIITPKYIKKVIFYPNSFVKVINPSGRKLKYVFVNKDGNIDKEYYYNSDDEYQEDGKYLWELCKDGKFRKYYIENDNK